jgi:hypothetical protein
VSEVVIVLEAVHPELDPEDARRGLTSDYSTIWNRGFFIDEWQ